MKNSVKFWDGIAEKYAKSPIEFQEAYETSLERTRSYLKPADHVLEVGCGTGSTALILAENVKHITATDISANMIKIGIDKARDQNIANITFVTADVLNLAIDEGPYDVVMALNLLHLLEDLPAGLKRIHSLLKPEGVFISKTVTQFGTGTPLKYRLMKLALPLMQAIGKAPFVNFMSTKELDDAILAGGFEIIETGAYPTRYVVARKI